jgi:phage-related protein
MQWVMAAGNVLALIMTFVAFLRWLRSWAENQIAQPISEVKNDISDLKSEVTRISNRADKAHERIDNILTQTPLTGTHRTPR